MGYMSVGILKCWVLCSNKQLRNKYCPELKFSLCLLKCEIFIFFLPRTQLKSLLIYRQKSPFSLEAILPIYLFKLFFIHFQISSEIHIKNSKQNACSFVLLHSYFHTCSMIGRGERFAIPMNILFKITCHFYSNFLPAML